MDTSPTRTQGALSGLLTNPYRIFVANPMRSHESQAFTFIRLGTYAGEAFVDNVVSCINESNNE